MKIKLNAVTICLMFITTQLSAYLVPFDFFNKAFIRAPSLEIITSFWITLGDRLGEPNFTQYAIRMVLLQVPWPKMGLIPYSWPYDMKYSKKHSLRVIIFTLADKIILVIFWPSLGIFLGLSAFKTKSCQLFHKYVPTGCHTPNFTELAWN